MVDIIKTVITRVLFLDFIKGLLVTLKYTLSRSITLKYPDHETWIPYERFRGEHKLHRNEDGRELCVACELCVAACPTDCITVVPMEDETGRRGINDRVAKVWEVNLVRCLYCGYCEDACPTTAVRLSRGFELACTDLDGTIREREALLTESPIPEHYEGGVVVKAKYIRKLIQIKPELWKQKDWWPAKPGRSKKR